MSNQSMISTELKAHWLTPAQRQTIHEAKVNAGNRLAAAITKASSKQTYYTIRFLADRDRVATAYRAYAYFRWVDDQLDEGTGEPGERLAFAERQQTLIDGGYQGKWLPNLAAEEHLLVDLIENDAEPNSDLQSYIRNMLAVMVFDAQRRGRLISAQELAEYSRHLATAVTDALHYCIGHNQPTLHTETRYLAVTGAHITHMLRDAFEDAAAGYFNIPREFLAAHGLNPGDITSAAYREWVKSRVELARTYFATGADYLAQVRNIRFRMAGFAYIARFTGVLDAIEREDYCLRPEYPERKSLRSGLRIGWTALRGLRI